MSLQRTFKLSNGRLIPAIGLGTWGARPSLIENAIKHAVDSGYRHFDCGAACMNEDKIGKALSKLSIPRGSLFVTSKLWNDKHSAKDVPLALQKTLTDLKLDYLDLYLIHWPITEDPATKKKTVDLAKIKETWQAMEKLVDEGKIKSIGVSNFTISHLKDVLSYCKIKPVMNQVEMHPYLPQNELLKFCNDNDIRVTAYSPLGSIPKPGQTHILSDPLVAEIAKRNGKTPAQVLISWAVQRGTVVIPKSATPERISSNFQDFILSESDMALLNNLHLEKTARYVQPKTFFGIDLFGDQ